MRTAEFSENFLLRHLKGKKRLDGEIKSVKHERESLFKIFSKPMNFRGSLTVKHRSFFQTGKRFSEVAQLPLLISNCDQLGRKERIFFFFLFVFSVFEKKILAFFVQDAISLAKYDSELSLPAFSQTTRTTVF